MSKFTIESLEMVISGIEAGIWDWDFATDQQVWSDHFYTLLGYQPDEIAPGYDNFLNYLVYPDDREIVENAVSNQLERKIKYKVQVRLKTKYRGYRYFECSGNARFLDEKPVRMVGSITDIHDQFVLKEKLLQNEALLKDTSQLAKIGAWEFDPDTAVLTWSPKVFEMHELDENENLDINRALGFYKSWSRPIIEEAIAKALENGAHWDLELSIESAKGKDLWVRIIGKPVIEGGKVTRLHGVIQDLTESKMIEEKLSVIFQYSTDAHLIFDEKGIIDCNRAAVTMLKCRDKAELLSLHPATFSPEFQPDGIRSADKSVEMDRIAYETGYHQFEWMHKRTTGEEFPVEVTLNPVQYSNKEALLVVWHDITKRKQAEEIIRRNEAMLTETQQLTHSGSWEVDLVTGRNHWSDETFRIFGLTPSSSVPEGDEFYKMIHADDREMFRSLLRDNIHELSTSDLDLRILMPDETVKIIHLIGKPYLNEAGKAVKLYGAIVDIDSRKKEEQELIRAKEQAESAVVAKSQFLSTMSHEIRTPLNAVIGFTHLLLQNDPKPEQKEHLEILKYSAENLLVLVNDILDFNKIEAGKIEFEEFTFNMHGLLEKICYGNLQTATEKGINLKLDVSEDLNKNFVGDPARLGQILTNLVSNAVKFTDTGEVVLSASIAGKKPDYIAIEFKIKDSGIGIPSEKIEYIFDSFTQAASDTTRKYGGSGLGLAITKRLLELQKSEIKVQSELGKGSVFSFSLDFKLPPGLQESKFANKAAQFAGLTGTRILIAEDNRINIILIRNLMKQWDVTFDVAENGLIAFELAKVNDYDLILMDLQMPEMDGIEATRKIRLLPESRYSAITIIALTASAILDIKDSAFSVGMNDYISKPINPQELYSKIVKHLGIQNDKG